MLLFLGRESVTDIYLIVCGTKVLMQTLSRNGNWLIVKTGFLSFISIEGYISVLDLLSETYPCFSVLL